MTAKEYKSLYAKTRKQYPLLQLETYKKIKDIYIESANEAAAVVQRAVGLDLSTLTSSAWSEIERQLRTSANNISTFLEKEIPELTSNCYWLTEKTPGIGKIESSYLKESFETVGWGRLITPSGIDNIYTGLNNRLITALVTREYQDGYIFSERIWGSINLDYQEKIKNIISTGLAQGRDVTKIAKDIQVYAGKGKDYTFSPGRYGKLKPGSVEYYKRIGKSIDYRALRLARSELYASMQQAGSWAGQTNPACQNQYDWVLNPGRQEWPCLCSEYAHNSPYTYEKLPGYPHPLCSCIVRAVMMNHDQFISDLKTWMNGSSVDYLDSWYFNIYLPAKY